MLQQGLQQQAAVVDLLLEGLVGREPRLPGRHPGRQAVVFVLPEVYRQHAGLEVHGEPGRHEDLLLQFLDGPVVVVVAEVHDLAGLEGVVHGHLVVRVLGDNVPLVVEDAVGLDGGAPLDHLVRLSHLPIGEDVIHYLIL